MRISEYIKKNKKRSILVIGLDIAYYILLFVLGTVVLLSFVSSMSSIPLAEMGVMLQSAQQTQELESIMYKALAGVILSLALIPLFLVLLTSVMKMIIWRVFLKKKISIKILLKSIALVILYSIIFILPLIIAFQFFAATYNPLYPDQLSYTAITPFLIVLLILFYVTTIGMYYLAKEEKIFLAIGKSFKIAVLKAHKLLLVYLALIVFFWILRITYVPQSWYIFLGVVGVVIASFVQRVFLSKL